MWHFANFFVFNLRHLYAYLLLLQQLVTSVFSVWLFAITTCVTVVAAAGTAITTITYCLKQHSFMVLLQIKSGFYGRLFLGIAKTDRLADA